MSAHVTGGPAFARIAHFQGGDPDRVKQQVEEDLRTGPPPGLEDVKGIWLLADRENDRGLAITLFDSKEGLERGDAALNSMSPEDPDARRTSVEFYEVILRHDL